MFLSPDYVWLEPVIMAAVIVFLVDLIGNMIEFDNRFVNALVTAVLFAVIFGVLVYAGYGKVAVSISTTPSATAPAN